MPARPADTISPQQCDRERLDQRLLDDIVRFLTDCNRSGFGRITLTVEGGKITRANFDESVKYPKAS